MVYLNKIQLKHIKTEGALRKYIIVVIATVLIFAGCAKAEKTENDNQTVPQDVNSSSAQEISEEAQEITTTYLNLDSYFDNVDGTAVFLTGDGKEYIYNEDIANNRYSPYSTFKIVSTLIGLDEGIITSKDSTMTYDGTIYWYDAWNANLNLEQAFKNSCVWYYHQIIYTMSQQTVQEHLNLLNYGNLDISQFNGNASNPQADLNGFWLSSSLEISPLEQVYLLKMLFEEQAFYSTEHIELVKELMSIEDINAYGKTGSGGNESWYVGFFEHNNENIYFATFIQGEDVSGAKARELSISIIENWHSVLNGI